jgi:hypothetical protein
MNVLQLGGSIICLVYRPSAVLPLNLFQPIRVVIVVLVFIPLQFVFVHWRSACRIKFRHLIPSKDGLVMEDLYQLRRLHLLWDGICQDLGGQ